MFFVVCLFPGSHHSEPNAKSIMGFNLKSFILRTKLHNVANHFPHVINYGFAIIEDTSLLVLTGKDTSIFLLKKY